MMTSTRTNELGGRGNDGKNRDFRVKGRKKETPTRKGERGLTMQKQGATRDGEGLSREVRYYIKYDQKVLYPSRK
jgi:hypothetical protein